jgi:hypothetical protein
MGVYLSMLIDALWRVLLKTTSSYYQRIGAPMQGMFMGFLTETKVYARDVGDFTTQIFWLVDLMLAEILRPEARCNCPSENENPTKKFVMRPYHHFPSTMTAYKMNPALQAITYECPVRRSSH